jgi:hypothetical protein
MWAVRTQLAPFFQPLLRNNVKKEGKVVLVLAAHHSMKTYGEWRHNSVLGLAAGWRRISASRFVRFTCGEKSLYTQ